MVFYKRNIDIKHRRVNWIIFFLIVCIATLIYFNSLRSPFFFDDIPKIVNNPDIKKLSNLKNRLIYPYNKEHKTFERNDPSRPLTSFTFSLNYHIGKLNSFGYHIINLLLHILNAILLFFFTKKILFYTYKKDFLIFPLLTSLFFTVHPVNTQTVTYIFARSGILATFFYILSVLFFIAFYERRGMFFIISILLWIMALLSKQIAVTLPAIILILDFIFLSNFKFRSLSKRKYYHIIFWGILAVYVLWRYFYLGNIGDAEQHVPFDISFSYYYFISQIVIVLKYIQFFIIPFGLCIDHTLVPLKSIIDTRIALSIIVHCLIIGYLYWVYRKNKGESKIIIFSIVWFYITLSPVSAFFPTARLMDEKRMYLSGFGFYFILTYFYFFIFNKLKLKNRLLKIIIIFIPIFHICILGILTMQRNVIYQDRIKIWESVIRQYPNDSNAYGQIASLYVQEHKYSKAFEHFQKALVLDPFDYKFHSNLANLYKDFGKYDKAMNECAISLKLNPQDDQAINIRGIIYFRQKEYDKAIREYQKALTINPYNPDIYSNLGILYFRKKEFEKAIELNLKAISIHPDYSRAYCNLGTIYDALGQYKKAVGFYQKTLFLNQDDFTARNNLIICYCNLKYFNKAIYESNYLLKKDPNNPQTYYNLGICFYSMNNYEQAIKNFKKAIKLDYSYKQLSYKYIKNANSKISQKK